MAISTSYEPVERDEALSIVGEALHTGLRKGTDAPRAMDTWRAIRAKDSGWSDALEYLFSTLDEYGIEVVRTAEAPTESTSTVLYVIQVKKANGLWRDSTEYSATRLEHLDKNLTYLRDTRGFEVRVVKRTTVVTDETQEG